MSPDLNIPAKQELISGILLALGNYVAGKWELSFTIDSIKQYIEDYETEE